MTTHENISYELKEVKWFMQRRLSALRNVTFSKIVPDFVSTTHSRLSNCGSGPCQSVDLNL